MLKGRTHLLPVAIVGAAIALVCGQAPPTATHPYPPGDQGDVWLLGGQSNMNGNGRMEEQLKPDPRILFYARNVNRWVIAREPLGLLFFPDHPDAVPIRLYLLASWSGCGTQAFASPNTSFKRPTAPSDSLGSNGANQ